MLVLFVAAAGLSACSSHRTPAAPTFAPQEPLLLLTEEHGASADLILASTSQPAVRWKFASVSHAVGWGIRAASSPDERTVAYAVLPVRSTDPDTDANLWSIVPGQPQAHELAEGIDLRSDLVWSPDGEWVSYIRVSNGALETHRVSSLGHGDQLLARGAGSDAREYLMGYQADGAEAVFARLSTAGTDVHVQSLDGASLGDAHVGDLSSRGFAVAVDGTPLLLLLERLNAATLYQAVAVSADGQVRPLVRGEAEDTGIAVAPNGAIYVGVAPGATAAAAALPGVRLLLPSAGFDVPLSVSPDGRFVAIRHFTGASTEDPGNSSLQLLDSAGSRRVLSGESPLDAAGWLLASRLHQ